MPDIVLYTLLFSAGIFAGCIDSIAGGGGLITLPALLALGFPPHLALGTNKFQSSFGSFTASYYYLKKGYVNLSDSLPGIMFTLIGASAGVICVQLIDSKLLNYIIPFCLIGIIVYTFTSPKLGVLDVKPKYRRLPFYAVFGFSLGFYDGFFGPGTGSFWAIAFVTGLGFNLVKATAYTKIMNFTSNIISFVLFLAGGHILFTAGIIMAIGQIIGSKIGAELVIKKGAGFIRPVFIIIVTLTTIKILYNLMMPS